MNGDLGRSQVWNADIWGEIDKVVTNEAGRLRVAQKVFECVPNANAANVPVNIVNAGPPMSIQEGQTVPFLQISQEFTLTQNQVANEATLRTGRTLAGIAARSIAFAEDALFFQGSAAALPAAINVLNRPSVGNGLLGIARNNLTLAVSPPAPNVYGDQTFAAVVTGINELVQRSQPGPYALVLESSIYADTHRPTPGSLVTTANRIAPLVPGGFYASPTLLTPLPVLAPGAALVQNILPAPAADAVAAARAAADAADAAAAAAAVAVAAAAPADAARTAARAAAVRAAAAADAARAAAADAARAAAAADAARAAAAADRAATAADDAADEAADTDRAAARAAAAAAAALPPPLPPGRRGLLMSLGGEPTKIFISTEAATVFTHVDGAGLYHFQVCERVQIVAGDPTALIGLYFR